MEVTGITWGGTRTQRFDEMKRFLSDVLGLEKSEEQEGFVSYKTSNEDKFELFGPDEREHEFMTTGPVIGFGVGDVDGARAELEAAGIEFLAPTRSEGNYRWAHFRGPDGNVYEITSS